MAPKRFLVLYTPRDKVVAAAKQNGWTAESGDSMLDAVGDHFSFEEEDSRYTLFENALARAKELVVTERDLFGQTTVAEEEWRLIVPADNYSDWETVYRHNVDETGLIETVPCGEDA